MKIPILFKQRLLALLFTFLIVNIWGSSVTHASIGDKTGVESSVGRIEKMNRNTIELLDESDRILKRFIYFGKRDSFAEGDRVRVLYYRDGNRAHDIRKMTPLAGQTPEAAN